MDYSTCGFRCEPSDGDADEKKMESNFKMIYMIYMMLQHSYKPTCRNAQEIILDPLPPPPLCGRKLNE